MTGSYKREARRRTAQRVEDKSRALDPAAGLDREFEDRIERDDAQHLAQRCEKLRRERDRYRQAALELQAAIRGGLAWIGMDAEPSVAHSAMRKAADHWYPILAALDALEALKSDPRLVSPPVEGRSQDTTTPDGEGASRGGP